MSGRPGSTQLCYDEGVPRPDATANLSPRSHNMPAGRESIANTPLSGAELRELMIADFRRLVESHGLLSNHVAYGRIGYELIVRLHPANATFQDRSPAAQAMNDSSIKSRTIASNLVKEHPELAAIDSPPLAGIEPQDAVVVASRLTRDIDSPNRERLREGLPIPTTVRDQAGNLNVEMVHREADPSIGAGNVEIDDDTAAARDAWKLPPEPILISHLHAVLADAPGIPASEPKIPPPHPSISPAADAEADRIRKLAEFYGVDQA